MSIERESGEEIVKRSPLLKSILGIRGWQSEVGALKWIDEISENLKRLDVVMKREVDADWLYKSYIPVTTAVNAIQPIFRNNYPLSPILNLALFGAGYEIGDSESVTLAGTEAFTGFSDAGILSKDVDINLKEFGKLIHDEVVLPNVLKSILAEMMAGASFKEGKLTMFDDYLKL